MGFSIQHINKYKRWVNKERAIYKDNKLISKKLAKLNLDLDIAMLRKKTDSVIDEKASKKHEWILNYMEQKCADTIARYQDLPAPENLYKLNPDLKVWSMWWDGEEKADKMFKMCIDSARRHTKQDVITLSKENYKDYFEIPDYILKKHEEGKIQIQHICDLMVVSILAEQGGFFTGATVWWSQDVSEELLRTPFYVCRAVTERQYLMSRSRWVGYLIAGNKEFPLFSFARDCLYEYWSKCDKAVDYLMLDYIFEFAYRNIPCVKEMLDNLPEKNNMLRNELIDVLSEPYDEEEFKRFTEGDTFVYKLSWKFGKKDEKTADGSETNYGHMLAECKFKIGEKG